jgi:hypothetical protein
MRRYDEYQMMRYFSQRFQCGYSPIAKHYQWSSVPVQRLQPAKRFESNIHLLEGSLGRDAGVGAYQHHRVYILLRLYF